MMPRRFLNLVMMDLRVSGSYWLSRMRPEENLFYSSAVEAVAQVAENKRVREHKPVVESTLDLPSPKFRFKSSRARDSALTFLPFYGPSEGRVVVADSRGDTLLYDADVILPNMNEDVKGMSPISLCVTNPKNAFRPDALYTINRVTSANFRSLVYCTGDTMAWRWLDLPEPPYFTLEDREDCSIRSHALLGDGKTISFSGGFGTYCFDTDSQEWTKAGSWGLPFRGRASRVPELYDLYFGFHKTNADTLVALELPSPLDGNAPPPKVLHRWRGGFCPPTHRNEYWSLMESSLLYLGSYRFCIAKWYAIYYRSPDRLPLDMVAVLTGVEIVDGQANKDKLKMVKHKTRTFIFEGCNLESVI